MKFNWNGALALVLAAGLLGAGYLRDSSVNLYSRYFMEGAGFVAGIYLVLVLILSLMNRENNTGFLTRLLISLHLSAIAFMVSIFIADNFGIAFGIGIAATLVGLILPYLLLFFG